jgi:hypothetical protein
MLGLYGSYKTGESLRPYEWKMILKGTGKVSGNIRRVGVHAFVRKKTLRIHMQYLQQPGTVEVAKANRVAQATRVGFSLIVPISKRPLGAPVQKRQVS